MNEYRHTKNNPCHISVGGVAYKENDGQIYVIILGRHEQDGTHYHLPKGTLRFNETLEECAKREVLEESGYKCDIGEIISTDTQRYKARDGILVEKTLIYFAMTISKNTGQHDTEHDTVYQIAIEEAIKLLRTTEPKKKEYLVLERFLKK